VILFLDFDGVTHPFFPRPDLTDQENALFSCLPAIEDALRAHPHVRVVISSSWRMTKTPDELRTLFSPDLQARVIGQNPLLPDHNPNDPGARMTECLAWLAANGEESTPWVALDDFEDLYSPGAALVVCHDGFRGRERALLEEALNDPDTFRTRYPVRDASLARLHPEGGGLLFLPPGVELKK
jgi:hypothetical protein